MLRYSLLSLLLSLSIFAGRSIAQQVTGQDLDAVLQRADKLLDDAKAAYEDARSKSSVEAFVDAGFKLEDARIKYLVLQEIGSTDKQKIATDRLRAINQLSKLIHDGKVAIGGTPAEPSRAKDPDKSTAPAPDAKDLVPPPASPPIPPPVDVSKRLQVPDQVKQREAEKQVKDLFKEQYAKKTSADRKALARLLLDQSAKSQEDPVALWVLYREAHDVSVQNGDARTAIETIDATARTFDIDAMPLKSVALATLAKNAKAPEEFVALTTELLILVDDLVRADQYDAGDKAATSAAECARKSKDIALTTRAATRAKEVSEARTLFQAMKSVLQILAKTPDDPGGSLEMGKFLCYVKGSWDLGLRFIVKGSDPMLKALAERELASPLQPAGRVGLGDAWYELAEKEKSPLRKSQLLAHSRVVYESALADSPPLVRARIEKRIASMNAGVAPTAPGQIDLLAMIDPAKDQVNGVWSLSGKTLVSPAIPIARIQIPYIPPPEYDLRVVLQKGGSDLFYMGLSDGRTPFSIHLDAKAGTISSIVLPDSLKSTPGTSYTGEAIPRQKESTLLFQVRNSNVRVSINGKLILEWKGALEKMTYDTHWQVPNNKALSIGSFSTLYEISEITLTPFSGQGKKLR